MKGLDGCFVVARAPALDAHYSGSLSLYVDFAEMIFSVDELFLLDVDFVLPPQHRLVWLCVPGEDVPCLIFAYVAL